jgi:hypothetical protein
MRRSTWLSKALRFFLLLSLPTASVGVVRADTFEVNNTSDQTDMTLAGGLFISASAMSGAYYIDGFESRRKASVGPWAPPPI